MPEPDVVAYVRAALPRPPARVLEVGAGDGSLAGVLAGAGYEVVALDPAGAAPVLPVALEDYEDRPRSVMRGYTVLAESMQSRLFRVNYLNVKRSGKSLPVRAVARQWSRLSGSPC